MLYIYASSINCFSLRLEEYEEQILIAMYDSEIIAMNYKSIEKVRAKVNWTSLQQEYKIKKSFPSIMKKLENKGYVSSHGKSGLVYSLTDIGVFYVKEKGKSGKEEDID
jgi:hypothetical protein